MSILFGKWQNRVAGERYEYDEYAERGIQAMCAECANDCKVLGGTESKFVCFGFMPKAIAKE